MDWFDEEDIQLNLKEMPKFKMNACFVQQIKSSLTNIQVRSQTGRHA